MKNAFRIAIAFFGFAGSVGVNAQLVAPAPVRQLVDGNGVDLFSGSFHAQGAELALGTRDQGLSYRQLNYGPGWTDNVSGFIETLGGVLYVSFGGVTDSFTSSGGTYASTEGNGAKLTLSGSTYTYTKSDGTIVHIDASKAETTLFYASGGLITDVETPAGDTLTYTYSSQNYCAAVKTPPGVCVQQSTAYRVNNITDSFGYRLTYSYPSITITPSATNSGSQISKWATANGIAAANLAVGSSSIATESFGAANVGSAYIYSITDNMSRTTQFPFTSNGGAQGYVGGITWPSSSSQNVTISYNGGKVASVSVAGGATTTYAFSVSGSTQTTTVTDGAGDVTTYVFNTASQRLTSKTDANKHTTSYLTDSYGRVSQVTYPEGGITQYSYDINGNLTTTTQIAKTPGTPVNLVTSAVFPCSSAVTCNKPSLTKDANQNETDYTYDQSTGKVLSITSPAATAGGVRPQIRYSYTSMQAYFLNGTGSIVASGQPVQMLTGISICRTTSSCVGTADETKTTKSFGPQTSGVGNNLLPISISVGAGDGSLTETTSTSYDTVGNPYTTTDPLGNVTRYRYDADRELVGVVNADPDGSGPLKDRAIRTTYTADGLVSEIDQGTVPSQSDADWANFSTLQYRTVIYDSADRKNTVSTWSAGGQTFSAIQFSYDAAGRLDCTAVRMNTGSFGSLPGACSASTQGSYGPDRISRNSYDAVDRLLSVIDGYGTSLQRTTVSYTYTPDGKVQTLTDAKGNLTAYNYDGFDRPLQTAYPLPNSPGNASTTDYEQVGYDANGNVTSKRLRDGNTVGFVYDTLNRLTQRNSPHLASGGDPTTTYGYDLVGHLTSAGDENNHLLSFGYDALGRKTSEASVFASATMAYDAAGRRTQLKWSDGFYVTYGYDNANEMTAITENGTSALVSFAYDDLGRRTARYFGNGVGTTYGYDPVSELTQLALNVGSSANVITLGSYSPAGEIGSRAQSNDAYAYTGSVNANAGFTTNGLNQYTAIGGVSQGYDGRGNLTTSGSTSYSYNSRNEMVGGTNIGGYGFYYDPIGRLDTDGPESLWFGYDDDKLITEVNYSGHAIARRYVFGPGTDEPLVWYEGSGTGSKHYMDADERGSITRITDGSGNLLNTLAYDEYGMPQSTNAGRFQYTGQVWLPSAGMYDYKARMYSPSFGRFLQTDPSGYGDGPNWYNYVHGNPVNHSDPTGLKLDDPTNGGGAEPETGSLIPGVDTGAQCSGNCGQSSFVMSGTGNIVSGVDKGGSQQFVVGDWASQTTDSQGNLGYYTTDGNGNLYWNSGFYPLYSTAYAIATLPLAGVASVGEAAVAEGGETTIGDILTGYHPDTMIHLTNDSASAFASGVDQGTFFARFGDVSEMTVPQYQSDVVGMGAAAGPGQPVSGFITAAPGNAGAFGQAGVWNNAGIIEYTNGMPFIPSSYVPVQ